MITNLTPHEITVVGDDGKGAVFAPSGSVARVSTVTERRGDIDGIPVYVPTFGDVEGLPAPQAGEVFIVSALVRLAVPNRTDVMSPGELVRDADGKPIGCRGLTANAGWRGAEKAPQRIEYSDELVYAGTGGGSNRHVPTLLFYRPGEKPVEFTGSSIAGVCRVVRSEFHKNGKWSYTDYTIDVAQGWEAWMLKGAILGRIPRELEDKWNWYSKGDATDRYEVTSWAEVKSPEPVVRFFKFARQLDENALPV